MKYLLLSFALMYASPALAYDEVLALGTATCTVSFSEDEFPQQLVCKTGDKTILEYDVSSFEPPPGGREGKLMEAADFNRDGIPDLKVLAWWGATGNVGYMWFLADPKTGLLAEAPQYADCQDALDQDGCCENFNKGGMVGMIYHHAKMCPRNGKFVTVWTEHQDWNEESKCFFKTTSELDSAGSLKAGTPEKICDPEWQ